MTEEANDTFPAEESVSDPVALADAPPSGPELNALVAQLDAEAAHAPLAMTARETAASFGVSRRGAAQRYLSFRLAESCYAVSLSQVLEVQRPPAVTALPNLPDWVLGVSNLRGELISIVDLRAYLGLPTTAGDSQRRIAIVRSREHEVTIGLIVDQVLGIRSWTADAMRPPTAMQHEEVTRYVLGICAAGETLFAVLDLDRLLLSDSMRQFELD